MAGGDILQGEGGKWGTVSFGIPDFLQEIRDAVNDFAELLITFLEIANLALEFVKGFIKAFLDPLVAIIEAIIAAILEFLRTLKGIGLYITGDWALLGWPPEDLRGGYQGYERRMIARLTDRTDPTRPDVPSTTEVLGFFAYISVDPTDFERLINFIITLMKLFGLSFFPDTSSLPVPTIKAVKYGISALGVDTSFQFGPLDEALGSDVDEPPKPPPQKCRLSWVTQPSSQKHPLIPFPVLGPSGYIITVSTLPEGIPLKFARPRANTDTKPAGGDKSKQSQPREYGDVRDLHGRPVVLYGGAEMLVFKGSRFEFNAGIEGDGKLTNGYCQVYGQVGNEIVPLETLGSETASLGTPGDGKGSDYLLQRTFLITDGVTLAQWFAGEYGAVFDLADMPLHAKWVNDGTGRLAVEERSQVQASTYYFRVWSVGKHVAEEKVFPKWDFKQVQYTGDTAGQPFQVDLQSGISAISNPSTARKASFVGVDTQEYLKALQTALLVLVLSRADLPTLAEVETAKGAAATDKYAAGKWASLGFVKEPTGLEDARGLLQRLYFDITVMETPRQDVLKWRSDLFNRIKVLAEELYTKSGTNARVERYVVEATEQLRTFGVSDLLAALGSQGAETAWNMAVQRKLGADAPEPTLLEMFNPDNPMSTLEDCGFAPNMNSLGVDADELQYIPGVFQATADFLQYDGGTLKLVFEEKDPEKVLEYVQQAPEGLRQILTKFITAAGDLNVPDEYRAYLTARRGSDPATGSVRVSTSGDATPVFVTRRDVLLTLKRGSTYFQDIGAQGNNSPPTASITFSRGLVHQGGQPLGGGFSTSICDQAAMVLRIATADRAPGDGEWIALRLFDTWPELEEFLRAIENWVKALAEAVRSIADAIIKYIEFLQAQIVELQQLIRRINALIQSFLSFSFALPRFSGLMLQSQGTDGILADFVAAKNKPSDSPLAYGAGVAVVLPFAPGFIMDIIAVATADDDETPSTQDINGSTTTTRPPDAIGTEGVQPAPGPAPTDEPDVL